MSPQEIAEAILAGAARTLTDLRSTLDLPEEVFDALKALAESSERLALDLLVVPDPDDADEYHVQCPHCGASDDVDEVDESVRWNEGGDFSFENGRLTSVCWGLGDGNYEHLNYQCGSCHEPLALPDDIEEDWS